MGGGKSNTIQELEAEVQELRYLLQEARETIDAIRTGQVDALVVEDAYGHQLYTLTTADHAYRVFIEKMTEGAVTLNREGIILYCNSQFASMVGKSLTRVPGMRFDDFIASRCVEAFRDLFRRSWNKECKEEVLIKSGTGDIPVQLSLTALELNEGVTMSIILTDLSTQKNTQRLLKDSNQKLADMNYALEMSNNDLQQFASVASHDLQEPLRKIQIFSNLLKESGAPHLPSDSQNYINKIIDSSDRMKTLIVEVLNYSKLSAAHKSFEEVDLKTVIMEMLEDFELLIKEKKAEIIVGELPLIEANRGQMRQVLQNIFSNALKFSKEKESSRIWISAKRLREKSFESREDEQGPYCLISIKDNGIGFDEKYLSHIFTLFERLHPKDNYEGTGIGLAITKKIMEKHNGLVSAKSTPGEGAEFLLLLPINQEMVDESN